MKRTVNWGKVQRGLVLTQVATFAGEIVVHSWAWVVLIWVLFVFVVLAGRARTAQLTRHFEQEKSKEGS